MRVSVVILFVLFGAGADRPALGKDRVLTFPDDLKGSVYLGKPPERIDSFIHVSPKGTDKHFVARARGDVEVPEKSFVCLELTKAEPGDLAFLSELPPDSIHSLVIRHSDLNRTAMRHISTQQSLAVLNLLNCGFTPNAFDELPVLPDLLDLRISRKSDNQQRDESGPINPGLAKWIASSRKIEYLHTTPQLTTGEFEHLRNHPALEFVNVRIAEDAAELLSHLKTLPDLRSMHVRVVNEIAPESLGELNWPTHIEVYQWNLGLIDAELLQKLSPEKRLRKLRLYQVEIAEDFQQGLEKLAELEELIVSPGGRNRGRSRAALIGLPDTLRKLPKLTDWPWLHDVDRQTLRMVSALNHIERLNIEGVADDVTADDLKLLGNLTNLRDLNLSLVPLDDAGLRRLAGARQLESLSLMWTKVSGEGLAAFQKHQSLKRLEIEFSPGIRPPLNAFSFLPNLTYLSIGCDQWTPSHFKALYELSSLEYLSIESGWIDDSAALALSQLSNLRDLYIYTDGLTTDRSLEFLSRLPKLESLRIGGDFTPEGVSVLADMPALRSVALLPFSVTDEENEAIHQTLKSVYWVGIYRSSHSVSLGEDGIVRYGTQDRRALLDPLEMQPAPRLVSENLTTFGDGPVQLERLRGQVVLVAFWDAWCRPTTLPELTRLLDKYRDRGLRIIGVHSKDGADELPEYLKANPLPWPTVVDENQNIKNTYRVENYPTLYLIDRRGILRVAGIHNRSLEKVIIMLLDEKSDD